MIRVEQVIAGSAAEDAGLTPGDQLLAVDQRSIEDIVDFFVALQQKTRVDLLVQRPPQEPFLLPLEFAEDEDPGLVPAHPQPTGCGNNCLFCFVHQLPKGMRRTLYVKDEDYRFSWLYGSYITLGNISEEQISRIIRDQLSPLYISVHATDEKIRCQLLGKDVPPIIPLLQRLTSGGIELHTQVVLCPGFNDAKVLQTTITDLAAFCPQIVSLAIVPIGLTRYRDHLPEIEPVSPKLASETLDLIEQAQQQQLARTGQRFVFAADELYLRAARDFPPLAHYEELWQLENGVGMLALFRSEAAEVLLEAIPLGLRKVSLVTGQSFAEELESFATRLGIRTGCEIQVVAVENHFFGPSVTVTGLLTGSDIMAAFAGVDPGEAVIVPEVVFNEGESLLLDDKRMEYLEQHFDVPVIRVSSDPWGILDGLERLDSHEIEIVEG